MELATVGTILLWGLGSLALLAILVIWVVILAAVWVTVTGFMSEYKKSAATLKAAEAAEEARKNAPEEPTDYLE